MPIYNGGGGVAGIQVESDPSALKLANNLSDLPNLATARTNLQLSTYFSALNHNHNGTYAPVSHSHAISDVTNLQTSLDGKASSAHTHDVTDVTGWGNVNGAANGYVLGWNGSSIVWVAQSGGGTGDRYLTTSTTSLTLENATITLTVGTSLSYTPTQSVTIAYDASNHMHGEVLTYNSATGVMTVDINHHTGTGTYTSWTVNVGGVAPSASVTWGSVTGTLSSQTDLQSALDGKLPVKSVNVAPYGSYTLVSTDANKIVHSSGGGNIIIPQDSTYSFPVGTVIIVTDTNNGVSVAPEVYGGQVAPSVNSNSSSVSIGYGKTCVKVGADNWMVF